MNKYLKDRVGPGKDKTRYKEANSCLSLLNFKLGFPICNPSVNSYLDTARVTQRWNSCIFSPPKPAQRKPKDCYIRKLHKNTDRNICKLQRGRKIPDFIQINMKGQWNRTFSTTFPTGLPAEVKRCLF